MNYLQAWKKASNTCHKSPMDEIMVGEFIMVEYWGECEANSGRKLTYEEVKEMLIKDLTND